MPKRYPDGFKRDGVTGAGQGSLTIPEFATDFGIAEETFRRWMRQAVIDEGCKEGMTNAEQSKLVRLRREKRRLEMGNEILRRAAGCWDSQPRGFAPGTRTRSLSGTWRTCPPSTR